MSTTVDLQQTASAYLAGHPEFDRLVIGAAISHQSAVLIVQRASHERAFPDQWEIPGGGVDPLETIEQAVVREVFEETNLKVTKVTRQFEGFDYVTKNDEGDEGTKRSVQLNFCVQVENPEDVKLAPEEHQDFAWCTQSNIAQFQMTPAMHTVVTNALAQTA
ncbi:hypothetical protein H4S02_007641 [Coemansia sp. RSA 2611]|nr:hypothetical protein H4S01_003232 [Coemansia sp. RSA 2610]KAJ2377465.1 hypothetical protein H4S02_007641 [Coemansia sp. RSA 2611]